MRAIARLAWAWVVLAAAPVLAQQFDVPYVPTPQVVVDEMLTVAGVGPKDYVLDLGSGDGRIPITAVKKFGARATGVDIDPVRIAESLENAREPGLEGRVEFVNRDLFQMKLDEATVITMYLLPRINLRLRPRLLNELRPGTRIVSHDFTMGDWKPDRTVYVQKNIFHWVIPAKVAGRWTTRVELPIGEREYDIEVSQRFQVIDGYVRGAARNFPLYETRVNGTQVQFTVVDENMGHRFDGQLAGDVIEGTVRSGAGSDLRETRFRMTRVESRPVKVE